MEKTHGRLRAFVVAGLVLALALSACADDDDSTSEQPDTNGGPSTTEEAEPQTGGVLRFVNWSWGQGLDPTITSAYGNFGGTELGSIYDRLVEWNPETKEYEPKTASSLTSNADFTQWTVKLRPGIKFSDGTDYDAAAVKFNFDRHKEKNANLRGLLASVTSAEVVDPLTVKYTLAAPWSGFPIVLNNTPGMIASPTAIQRLGDDAMKTNPVGAGAGPFVVQTYRPNDTLELVRNESYWNGPVYLDGVRFVVMPNGATAYETLQSGGADAVYLRDSRVVAEAREDDTSGYTAIVSGGETMLINNGLEITCMGGEPASQCAGKADNTKVVPNTPGTNPKVRQAVAAAIDVRELDRRVNDGVGIPALSLYDDSFPWNPNVPLPEYDVGRARQLVDEAKAAGWDGRIRLTCAAANDPQRQAEAVTLATMLQAAGMTVDSSRTNLTPPEMTADVIVKRDFDLAGCFGLQITPDDNATAFLDQNLRGNSPSNRTGYRSDAMDRLLVQLKAAGSEDERTARFGEIAELWADDVPQIPLYHTEESVFWADDVHGIRATGLYAAVLDKAWIG